MPVLTLNTAQEQAVNNTRGVVAVIAGPGTGKTHTLTARIITLIHETNIPAENILALTFTIKAAHEMRTRLHQHLLPDQPTPTIATLHSFCFGLLTQHHGQPPIIRTEADQLALLQTLLQQETLKNSPAKLLKKIRHAKTLPDPLLHLSETEQQIFSTYQEHLAAQGQYDYEDLIIQANRLFVENAPAAQEYQNQYQFIHVDEFQDLNQPQQALIVQLAQMHQNLFIIGDPDQSIYSFRGARPNGFEQITQHFPETKTYLLEDNYRSGQTILNTAHSLIAHDPHAASVRPLHSHVPTPGTITLMRGHNQFQEAHYIVEMIQRLLGGITRQNFDTNLIESHSDATYNFGDIVVLLRSRSQGRFFKRYLLKSGIPFEFVSEKSLLEYPELQSLITALQEKSRQSAGAFASLSQYLQETIESLQLDPTHETLQYLIKEAADTETGDLARDIPFFLQYLTILQYDNQVAIPADKVIFMTIHAAKGLEFPVVFVPGLDEGILPSGISHENEEKIAEERRLLYVAMTRAKQELYLSSANGQSPSRFLSELDSTAITETRLVAKRKKPKQPRLF